MKVAVVGVGSMGRNHARVYSELENAELIGVVDANSEQAKTVAEACNCPHFTGLSDLLDLGVEALSIAVSTARHKEVALECIARGIHLLIEKPIALTVKDGQEILKAAKEHGTKVMIGQIERFNPAVATLRDALKGQDIISIGITRVGPFPPRMSDVGVIIDLAVHDIDIIRWLSGSDIVEVQAQTSSIRADREDIALLQFRTENNVLAHVNTNWLTPFKSRTIQVATQEKFYTADLITRQVTEHFDYQADGTVRVGNLWVPGNEPLKAELMAFLSALEKNEPMPVSGEEGLRNLEIAVECLQ
ncbi:MAG: Gfo/Idh/MocA family oxidoreductase [Robiginitomaculum sp.]|nr:Gfo/Idh/MocA family oxidoreductase [Robiginitomaculum sp.]